MSSALTSPNLVAARSMISPASKAPRADDLMTYLMRAALKRSSVAIKKAIKKVTKKVTGE